MLELIQITNDAAFARRCDALPGLRLFARLPTSAAFATWRGAAGASRGRLVLDTGELVRIVELAALLIRLPSRTEQDVPITFTGCAGEKLYEELLADEETTVSTPHPKWRVAMTFAELPDVQAVCAWVDGAGPSPDEGAVREWLRAQVPEYAPR